MDLNRVIEQIVKCVKSVVSESNSISEPIKNQDNIVLSVNKISVGIVVGGLNKKKDNVATDEEMPMQIKGGGVTITPLGYMVLGDDVKFVSVDRSDNKWCNLVDDIVTIIKNKGKNSK